MQPIADFFAALIKLGIPSFFLVFIGWWVVYQNAKRLATRSETKGYVDELLKLVSEIEKSAVDYWLADAEKRTSSRNFEMLMLAKLSVLDHKISFLKARQLEIDDIDEQFSRLCESILLDCEQANQLPIDDSIGHANQVLASGGVIHSTLYQKFIEKYPPKL